MFTHPVKPWIITTDLHTDMRYRTKMSARNHSTAFAESQHHVINSTNPGGTLHDGIENRLHVRRRAADNAEHLGRCGLMVQRFAQLRGARHYQPLAYERAAGSRCHRGECRPGL